MIPLDYHMHSSFSGDCQIPMEAMCRAALAADIHEIGFTEHYDLHPNESIRDYFRPEAWWAELLRCRALFAGQLTIRAGIELGEPHLYSAECQAMLDRLPFDYCLGSLHFVGPITIFDNEFFAPSMDAAAEKYFTELEGMTRRGGFDILSHFDAINRVGLRHHPDYDPRRYEEPIRVVLKNVIANGIALDLNTATLRRKYTHDFGDRKHLLTPNLDILRWYVELGGERVTLGSDAHHPDQIGSNLHIALEIARAAGLKYLTQFEQRQATLVPIA